MYLDINDEKKRLAQDVFGDGRLFAYYDVASKQCTDLVKIAVDETGDSVDPGRELYLAPPDAGEAMVEILNIQTDTVIVQENYVDPEKNMLLRKPKVHLEWLSDPDFDPVKVTIRVRQEPYRVRVSMIDYEGKSYIPDRATQLKVKDRESLLSIKDPVINYVDSIVIEVKALYPGKNCCLRLKDSNYQFVPGLLMAEVLPPAW